MIRDIKELDDTGHEMKVYWQKANNYTVSFARAYFQVRQAIKNGDYGSDWNMDKWLYQQIGVWEKTVLDLLKLRERILSEEHKYEAARARKQAEIERAARRAAKQTAAAEKKRAEDTEKAEKLATLADAAASQATWDKYIAKRYEKAPARKDGTVILRITIARNGERREVTLSKSSARSQLAAKPASANNGAKTHSTRAAIRRIRQADKNTATA